MAEYWLSPAAEQDLENIWIYSFNTWGIRQAEEYTDMLFDIFSQLAQQPLSAPSCEDIRAGYRRKIAGKHTVYFQITDYGVAIMRVLHNQMKSSLHF